MNSLIALLLLGMFQNNPMQPPSNARPSTMEWRTYHNDEVHTFTTTVVPKCAGGYERADGMCELKATFAMASTVTCVMEIAVKDAEKTMTCTWNPDEKKVTP